MPSPATIQALLTLEEAVLVSNFQTVDTPEVRAALTLLWKASDRKVDWAFKAFWQWCSFDSERRPAGLARSQNLEASLNGIYRSVKVERSREMMFNEDIWERYRAAGLNRDTTGRDL